MKKREEKSKEGKEMKGEYRGVKEGKEGEGEMKSRRDGEERNRMRLSKRGRGEESCGWDGLRKRIRGAGSTEEVTGGGGEKKEKEEAILSSKTGSTEKKTLAEFQFRVRRVCLLYALKHAN